MNEDESYGMLRGKKRPEKAEMIKKIKKDGGSPRAAAMPRKPAQWHPRPERRDKMEQAALPRDAGAKAELQAGGAHIFMIFSGMQTRFLMMGKKCYLR